MLTNYHIVISILYLIVLAINYISTSISDIIWCSSNNILGSILFLFRVILILLLLLPLRIVFILLFRINRLNLNLGSGNSLLYFYIIISSLITASDWILLNILKRLFNILLLAFFYLGNFLDDSDNCSYFLCNIP